MQIHQIKGYIQNIFLVEYDHGCLLLDGASKADFPFIESFFKHRLQRPLTDLKVVVVTHMHPDHAGCAHLLREKSKCILITGWFDKQWYGGFLGRMAHLTDIVLAYWVANRIGQRKANLYYSPVLKPDLRLFDGDTIPFFDDWKVVSTPGHTDRDISLVNESKQKIYVADLIVKVKGLFTSPFPVTYPKDYEHSLNKLHQYLDYEIMMAHVPNATITKELIKEVGHSLPEIPKTNLNAIKRKLGLI